MWERVMKMKIEIRNDKAVVSGYVNAVGRDSRPITDVRGKFVEQIEPGAFGASLERSENVDLLLNHDKSRVYASTKDGSLKLTEDSIGLRAEAVLTDAEMIRKARSGEFRGWSFGMYVGDSAMEERAEGIPRRHVKSLNMFEVSLIDKSRIPCYVGTSVECRAEGEDVLAELRYSEEEPEILEEERSEPEPVDYSAVDNVISELRYGAVDNVIAELRYNPYHDPSNGRFTSGGGGGGGGVLVVEKGQKGKGYYVVPSEKFENGFGNIDDYLSDKSPMQAANIRKTLDKRYRFGSEVMSEKDFVENALKNDGEIVEKTSIKSKYSDLQSKLKTPNGQAQFAFKEGLIRQNQQLDMLKGKYKPEGWDAFEKFAASGDASHLPAKYTEKSYGVSAKGSKVYTEISKTAFDYANYLKGSKASRSFDPIDSKLEELRSSDPAD